MGWYLMADQTPTGDSAREADAPRRRLMRVVLSAVLMAAFWFLFRDDVLKKAAPAVVAPGLGQAEVA